ncbi:MAG: SGNH/GDSL hydrolase family protein [Saprospiraceae bacterium]
MIKNILSGLFTSFISLIVLLLLLEGGVRLFVEESVYIIVLGEDTWAKDDVTGWTNKSNFEITRKSRGEWLTFKTNEDGMRPYTAKREKEENVFRVMLIGNSTVAALDVTENVSIHYLLDSLLNVDGLTAEVINAGVNGYSTDQTLLALKKNIELYHPDLVAYGFCMNDLLANASTSAYGKNKPAYKLENGKLIALPLPAPNNDIGNSMDKTSIRSIIANSAFYGVLRPYVQKTRMALADQEKINQGGDFSYFEKPIDAPELKLLSLLLLEMENTCEKYGAKFLFYCHPEVATVWPPYREAVGYEDLPVDILENKLKEIADSDSLEFVPMVDYFLSQLDRGPFHLLPDDPHCNGQGYLLQAECLGKFVKQNMREEKDSLTAEN